jgi:PleD family two-component response regulator
LARPDDSAETIFARADGALYHAKQAGRNRIEIADHA